MHSAEQAVGDRFADWSQLQARLLLGLLAALMIAATVGRIEATGTVGVRGETKAIGSHAAASTNRRDPDLALYDRVVGRLARGENYYVIAAQEHRRAGFPLRPGVAVRLPTLAWLEAQIGLPGQRLAALALVLAVTLAWWRRLGEEPGGARYRAIGSALALVGVSLSLNARYLVLHELWAGALISLALALHRPGRRWIGAWLAAALALAIREHALVLVLLMGALALWRRDWKECAAWAGLVIAFGAGLLLHLHAVAQQTVPGDALGPGWLALRGLDGWISNIVLASSLDVLPGAVAAPLVVLMVAGWAGWRSEAGLAATLLCIGYGLAFMVAGRANNFYWGALVAPVMTIGLTFAPRALVSLARSAFADARAS